MVTTPTSLPAAHIPTAAELETYRTAIMELQAVPHAQLRQIVAQTFTTGVEAIITFTAEDVDSHNGHSTSTATGVYTGPWVGWYQLSGKVSFAASATGTRQGSFRKNGVVIAGSQVIQSSGDDTATQTVTVPTIEVYLNGTTDYVELYGLQDSGGNLDSNVGWTGIQSCMTIRWVRP